MPENSIKLISDKNNPYFKNNKLESGSSAPTTGTYSIGDMIINTNPSNGIYAWVCSVAGTPGTWIALPTMNHTHNYAGSSSAGGVATSATKLATPVNIKLGNSTKTFDGTANVTWTLSDMGVTAGEHTHSSLMANYNATESPSVLPTTLADGELRFDSRIVKDTTDLFPHSNNANAMISINRFSGAYNSQLGFSGNGNIYYRSSSASGTAWKQISMGNTNYSYCKSISSTDLNDLKTNGKYHGSSLTNSPDGTTNQFYIEVMSRDSGQLYVHQRATKLNSEPQEIYDRFMRNGTWYAWRRYYPKVFPKVFRNKNYEATACPAARSDAAFAAICGYMMLIGGDDANGNATNTNYRYSAFANAWGTRTAMPVKLSGASAASTTGDQIYVVSGSTKGTYCYDWSDNAWTTKTSMPATIAEYFNNQLTIIGSIAYYVNSKDGKIYKYDTSANSWTTLSTSIPQSRSYGSVASDGTRYIYQVGGYSGWSRLGTQVFDITTNTWTTKANFIAPYELQLGNLVYFYNKLYYVGGTDSISSYMSNKATYIYDIANNKWSSAGYLTWPYDALYGAYSTASVALYGNIYTAGGYDANEYKEVAICFCFVPD